jgi:hypothetical protein
VDAGAVTAADAERLVSELRAAADEGTAFASVTMYAAVARKPG